MAQLTYSIDPARGVAGMIADMGDHDVVSRLANQGAGGIPFGRFCARNAADSDDQVRLPSATGEVTGHTGGFAVADVSVEASAIGGGGGAYADGDAVPVLRRGRVLVTTESAATAGGAVYVRFAAGAGGTALGAVRTDADTSTAVALPGAYFSEDAAAGALVVIDLT